MQNKKLLKYLFLLIFAVVLTTQNSFAQKATDTNFVDKKGRRQGVWHKYEDGKLKYIGQFKDNQPYGTFKYYDDSMHVIAVSEYFRQGYAAKTTVYRSNGTLFARGFYLDQERDSTWFFYNEKGKLIKEEFYKKGLLEGISKVFLNDTVIETQEWYRGLRNGKWWQKGETGQTQTTTYKLNLSDGPYLATFANGDTSIFGMYADGLHEGNWMFYAPDKRLKKQDTYLHNQLKKRLVAVYTGEKLNLVDMDTVLYLTTNGMKILLKMQSGSELIADQSFEELTGLFDTDFFFFANPTFFVAFKEIKVIDEYAPGKASLKLKSDTSLDVELDENGLQSARYILSEEPVGKE